MDQLPCETDVCEQLCEHPQTVCLAKAEMLVDEDARQSLKLLKFLEMPPGLKFSMHFPKENSVSVTSLLSLPWGNLRCRINFVCSVGRGWSNIEKKEKWFGIHLTINIFFRFYLKD